MQVESSATDQIIVSTGMVQLPTFLAIFSELIFYV